MDRNNSYATAVPNDTIGFLTEDVDRDRQAMNNDEFEAVIDAQYEQRLVLDDSLPPYHAPVSLVPAAIANTATALSDTGLLLLEPSLYADPYYYPRCDCSPSSVTSFQNSGDVGYAEAGPSTVSGMDRELLQPFHDAVSLDANSGAPSDGNAWDLEQSQHRQQQQEITQPSTSNTATLNAQVALIEEFFVKNGAHRPPVPCNYCRHLRLQCLILQTTAANPNPIEACSSCVALYRDCSLAERSKRKAQSFETPLPVIGHLHGVAEEHDHAGALDGSNGNQALEHYQQQQQESSNAAAGPAASTLSYKRNSTRSVKRTRVLRHWFSTHYDHPYPTEEEKTTLADQCGLSKTQVINWFANARRRQRLTAHSHFNNSNKIFHRGSPMPPSMLTGMSPMERWRHSPPEEEPVSSSDIEQALSASGLDGVNAAHPHNTGKGYTSDGAPSSGSGDSGFFNPSAPLDASSNSASSSAFSFYQSDEGGVFSLSAQSSIHGDQDPGPSKTLPLNRIKSHIFQCTFCLQTFKKKYDWVRHERSIHLPGLDSWICTVPLPENNQSYLVWRMDQGHPECIFCGQTSPTDEHIQSHEFTACAERPVSERTFTRKDHLWQHLHKFHRCRKWEGWKPNLSLLQHRQDKLESQCGFCNLNMDTWDERAEHLAAHFRRGATMAGWTGGSGIKDRRDEGGTIAASKQRLGHQGSGDVGKCLELFSEGNGERWP
ncbi:Homeobox protein Meis1 [Cladobotryum mycophilum]|uniref:Homeobox protein Meis1 n=1 Tax=Cladobotryum mycophilum TaxID=491253 RepID=A0ABR0SPL0_9HYPO